MPSKPVTTNPATSRQLAYHAPVSDESLLRLLGLVTRQLDATDARLEIGGEPPQDPTNVWIATGPSRRLVACFDQPPSDRAAVVERLEALAEAFHDAAHTPPPPSVPPASVAQGRLDEQLEGLCTRTDASAALLIDVSSPMLWGVSSPALRALGRVDRLLDADPDRVEHIDDDERQRWRLAARAVRRVREELGGDATRVTTLRLVERASDFGLLARGLAGVYTLLLVFDAGFSETRAEGAVRRARQHLENLIGGLPPIEPSGGGPGGGKVVLLRPVE
jgi:hypothetical protein